MSKPATCKFTPFLRRCRVVCEPERHSTQESGRHVLRCKKKRKVETVETVASAEPCAALIGRKVRPLLSDSQSALADCEEDVIQMCHLFSRNGKLSLISMRLTKSFPTIPNLIGIVNANQNDERFSSCGQLCCSAPYAIKARKKIEDLYPSVPRQRQSSNFRIWISLTASGYDLENRRTRIACPILSSKCKLSILRFSELAFLSRSPSCVRTWNLALNLQSPNWTLRMHPDIRI